MSEFSNYDPHLVVVTYKEHQIQGFANGSMVVAELDEDEWDDDVGGQGDVVRINNPNEMGTVTIRLQQTSPSNTVLRDYQKADKVTGNGHGILMIRDLRGRTIVLGENAWIQKRANAEFADEHTPREWKFRVAKLRLDVGGNST